MSIVNCQLSIEFSFLSAPEVLVERDEDDDRRGDEGENDVERDGLAIGEEHVAERAPEQGDAYGLTI